MTKSLIKSILVTFVILMCNYTAIAQDNIFVPRLKALERNGLPYFYNDQVRVSIQELLANEELSTSVLLGKSEFYLPVFVKELELNGLPHFLKYIPIVNTGLAFNNVEPDGATGPWPMPFTIAKKYNLPVNSYVDQRRNWSASSFVAAAYLKDLHNIYKDWKLAIAAFRAGPVEINKCIRLGGGHLNYDSIHRFLPEEYQNAIVDFIAVQYVWNHYADHKINLLKFVPDKTDSVLSMVNLPFTVLAEKLGTDIETLRKLNPELKLDIVPYFNKETVFFVPDGKGRIFDSLKSELLVQLTPKTYVDVSMVPVLDVSSIDTGITRNDVVSPIIDTLQADGIVDTTESGIPVIGLPKPETPIVRTLPSNAHVWVYYTIKKGDGFWTLADIFDCTINEMKKWNKLNKSLIAGRKVKFYVPEKSASYYKKMNTLSLAQKQKIAKKD